MVEWQCVLVCGVWVVTVKGSLQGAESVAAGQGPVQVVLMTCAVLVLRSQGGRAPEPEADPQQPVARS